MSLFVKYVTDFASLGTIALGLVSAWLLFSLIFKKENSFTKFVADYKFWISFAIAFSGAALSLFYSQFAGFLPCVLCWWQRIFLYPLVFIFAVTIWKKDKSAKYYGLALAIPGVLIAIYHSYLQFGGSPLIPCSATVVSCAQRYFLEFGYVTIPTMSLTAFIAIILLMLLKD